MFLLSLHKKIISHFRSAGKSFFCEAATVLHFDDWANPESKKSRPLYMFNSPIDQEK
jgi:hypothetical protein